MLVVRRRGLRLGRNWGQVVGIPGVFAGDGAPPEQGKQAGEALRGLGVRRSAGGHAGRGCGGGGGEGVGDRGSLQQVPGRELVLQAFFKGIGDRIWSLTIPDGKLGCIPRCQQWGPTQKEGAPNGN